MKPSTATSASYETSPIISSTHWALLGGFPRGVTIPLHQVVLLCLHRLGGRAEPTRQVSEGAKAGGVIEGLATKADELLLTGASGTSTVVTGDELGGADLVSQGEKIRKQEIRGALAVHVPDGFLLVCRDRDVEAADINRPNGPLCGAGGGVYQVFFDERGNLMIVHERRLDKFRNDVIGFGGEGKCEVF